MLLPLLHPWQELVLIYHLLLYPLLWPRLLHWLELVLNRRPLLHQRPGLLKHQRPGLLLPYWPDLLLHHWLDLLLHHWSDLLYCL